MTVNGAIEMLEKDYLDHEWQPDIAAMLREAKELIREIGWTEHGEFAHRAERWLKE